MKRYIKTKHHTRVCQLGSLKKQYAQIEKLQGKDIKDVYVQELLEQMKLKINALEYVLN